MKACLKGGTHGGNAAFLFANFSGTRWGIGGMEHLRYAGESYLADCRFKKMEWKGLNLKRASFFHTPLKGMDLRGNEIEGIVLSEGKKGSCGER